MQDVGQALEHEQSRAVRMVVDVDAPDGGTTRALGLPILFNGTTNIAAGAPPRVGQDTAAVLRDFHFSDAEIARLVASGAVFQASEPAPAGAPSPAEAAAL